MPLYDYACTKCGKTVEVRHGFDESHAEPCAVCGAPVRRVFNAAPVLFKGSGFYVTDSRRSPAGANGEKAKSEGSTAPDTSKSEKPAAPKSEPKASEPAA